MQGKSVFGILLVAIGVIFIGQQLDLWELSNLFRSWWPLILIGVGLFQFTQRDAGSHLTGWIVLLIGGVFLAEQWVDVNLRNLIWPAIIVVVGIAFIFSKPFSKPPKRRGVINDADQVETFCVLGGASIDSQSTQFTGGEATSILGGVELDLRSVQIAPEGADLTLTSVLGSIEVKVPQGVPVIIRGTPILGACENKIRKREVDPDAPALRIHYQVILGGIEIRD